MIPLTLTFIVKVIRGVFKLITGVYYLIAYLFIGLYYLIIGLYALIVVICYLAAPVTGIYAGWDSGSWVVGVVVFFVTLLLATMLALPFALHDVTHNIASDNRTCGLTLMALLAFLALSDD